MPLDAKQKSIGSRNGFRKVNQTRNYASDDKRAGNVEDSNCSEFVNDSAAAVALSALDMIHFD